MVAVQIDPDIVEFFTFVNGIKIGNSGSMKSPISASCVELTAPISLDRLAPLGFYTASGDTVTDVVRVVTV
jgi:hypothetical protein